MRRPAPLPAPLRRVADDIAACARCPRLASWCGTFRNDREYWARGVPGFGDPNAVLLILGLAPGAHGANRTGRPFTGDAAGDFLYRGLHEVGLASRPESVSRDDGLVLRSAWITNSVKCCPPANKPTPTEVRACAPFLAKELDLLGDIRAVLALGKTAHDAWLAHVAARGTPIRRAAHPFAHEKVHRFGDDLPILVDTFHTSRYNVNTGKLTYPAFLAALKAAVAHAGIR